MAYDNKCAICEAKGKLFCHEVWNYDYKKRVQVLKAFEPLCWACHRVKHFGSTEMLIAGGYLSPGAAERLVRHFMRVNDCDRNAFEGHKTEATRLWTKRSKHFWKLDLGDDKRFIKPTAKPPKILKRRQIIIRKSKDLVLA
jgi:hypothetical protein